MGLLSSVGGAIFGKSSSGDQAKILRQLAADLKAQLEKKTGEVSGLSGSYLNKIGDLNKAYQTTAQQQIADTTGQRTALEDKYRNAMLETIDPEIYKTLSRETQEQAYRALPGQLAQVREALASTGGFARGAAAKALRAPILQTAQSVGDKQAAIQLQQMQDTQKLKQEMETKLYNMNDQFLQDTLGMNRKDAQMLLENLSGAELTNFNTLLDEINSRYNALASIYTGQAQGESALAKQRTDEYNQKLYTYLNAGEQLFSKLPMAFGAPTGGAESFSGLV